MFALRCDPSTPQQHTHLALSLESVGRTDVLDLTQDTFTHVDLPALAAGSPSLLLAAMPGGWLLQLTAREARVMHQPLSGAAAAGAAAAPEQHPVSQWRPQDGSSVYLGSSCYSHVALASGSHLHLLNAVPATGALGVVRSWPLVGAQVSALSLCHAGVDGVGGGMALGAPGLFHAAVAGAENLYLAVGEWVGKLVRVLRCDDGSEVCRVSMGGETPRSLAMLALRGSSSSSGSSSSWVLLAGSNTGLLAWWEVAWSAPPVAAQQQQQAPVGLWRLQGGRRVRISNVAVELAVMEEVAGGGAGEACTRRGDGQGIQQSNSCFGGIVLGGGGIRSGFVLGGGGARSGSARWGRPGCLLG